MGERSPYSKTVDRGPAWLLYGKCVSSIVLRGRQPLGRVAPSLWRMRDAVKGGGEQEGQGGGAERQGWERGQKHQEREGSLEQLPPANYPGGPSNGSFMGNLNGRLFRILRKTRALDNKCPFHWKMYYPSITLGATPGAC